jgi:transposase
MNQNSEGIYLTPFQRQMLAEKIAKEPPNAYRQRLEIILLTDRGKTQAAICRSLGCSPGTASRWIQLTKAGLAHQYLDCPVGRPKVVTDEYIEFLHELLGHSPRDYGYPFKVWTIDWLSKHIAKEKGIAVSHSHLKRVMRELGLSTRTKLQQSPSRSKANIFIADLPDVLIESDRAESGINLFNLQLDSKIYGAASSPTTYFHSAARRDFSDFAHPKRVSILSQ